MVELALIVYMLTAFFAYVGWIRRWKKELISLAGIALAIFALQEFRPFLTGTLLENLPPGQQFYIFTFLFLIIVFFAYQTRGFRDEGNADILQQKALGGLVGALNGYLISGTIWYFLDASAPGCQTIDVELRTLTQYALEPLVLKPELNTTSALMACNLPQYVLGAGEGNLLSLMVILLFIVVLVLI